MALGLPGGSLGPFVMVTLIEAESNDTFVTTTATVSITSELSGTIITCEDFPMTEVDIATLPDIKGNVYYLMQVIQIPAVGKAW